MRKKTVVGTPIGVVNLDSARAKRERRKTREQQREVVIEVDDPIEIAPLEAYSVAEIIEGEHEHYLVRVCDGDQIYMFAVFRDEDTSKLHVREIYPGNLIPETRIRTVETGDPEETELEESFEDIDEAQEWIEGVIMADFEDDDGSACGC